MCEGRTVNDDLPRGPCVDDARKVGVQLPLGIDIVLPMDLLEVREEVVRYVFVVVRPVAVRSDAARYAQSVSTLANRRSITYYFLTLTPASSFFCSTSVLFRNSTKWQFFKSGLEQISVKSCNESSTRLVRWSSSKY